MSFISRQTTPPTELKKIMLKHSMSDARDCLLEWKADFGSMELLLYASFISPALLLDFLATIHGRDERFDKTGITSAIQISNRFNIKLRVPHGEDEAWYKLRVYKLESHSEKFDRLEIELTAIE